MDLGENNRIDADSKIEETTTKWEVPPRGFATITIVVTPEGIPCVRDVVRFGPTAKWKFTGGEGNYGEDPRAAAVREVAEECGIRVSPDQLVHLGTYARKRYDIHVYTVEAAVPTDGTLKRRGDEGEEVEITPARLIRMMADDGCSPVIREDRDFLYMHYEMALSILERICSDESLGIKQAA